ncbi:MAG: ABC transporter substrate-binding protein [Candidatus Binatia bacterium]|nr:ABC transporter substrate-binding protein [Candidatus Binatia bacterium]
MQNVVVSYPSKSITSFPILDTARRKGFFQQQGLNVNLVYMRGGLDIKAVFTGDADFGTSTTTAVTAFVAGAPLRIVCSYNSHVDQMLYAQPKYRSIAQLKGQAIGSLNPGGLIDVLLRRVLLAGGIESRARCSAACYGRHAGALRRFEGRQHRGHFVELAA